MKHNSPIALTIGALLIFTGCATTTTTSNTDSIKTISKTTTNSNQVTTSTLMTDSTNRSFSAGMTLPATDLSSFTTTASGLQYKDITPGTGTAAKAGDTVTVDYTGTLSDGKKFDSSLDRATPFTFHLGAGQVIKGWDEGVAGMSIGQERILVIPASLGYGAAGAGGVIPGNATLQFAVKLQAIQ